jgi:zinc and cadmium transporter
VNFAAGGHEKPTSLRKHSLGFLRGADCGDLVGQGRNLHHAHEHSEVSQADISHHHSHGASGSWSVLFGDGVHAFADGILIASAFVADWKLGVAASFAVLLHEVPHHMGDL